MAKKLFGWLFIISTIQLKGQTVDISFSLLDGCIDQTKEMIAIQINVQNRTNKNIWVDLNGVDFVICQDDKIITPFEVMIIGFFPPNDKMSRKGFLRVKKMSDETAIIYTSLFKNYILDENKTYYLVGFYKSVRKRRSVYKTETDIGRISFKVCNSQ